MKRRTLDFLCCPECRSDLVLRDASPGPGGEIVSGSLRCSRCGQDYPILNHVPRFHNPAGAPATAQRFQTQWKRFQAVEKHARAQYFDWVRPVDEKFLAGKTILDAGCGMGRFTNCAAESGANYVIGVDLGDSVEIAHKLYGDKKNIDFIQADILKLPLGKNFDFSYSIGVLHHLSDPQDGFNKMIEATKKGGHIFAWVYGRENNRLITGLIDPIRINLTSKLPDKLLSFLSFALTCFLYPILKLIYLPVDRVKRLNSLGRFLFYFPYFRWLAGYDFQHAQHVIYDHLTAPVAHYIPQDEFLSWFVEAGCSEPVITPRNRNSWRGFGRVGR